MQTWISEVLLANEKISPETTKPYPGLKLDKADHIILDKTDAQFVADEIAKWFKGL